MALIHIHRIDTELISTKNSGSNICPKVIIILSPHVTNWVWIGFLYGYT